MGCTWRADLGQCHLTFVNLIQASLSAAAVNARWACRKKKKNLFVCFFSSLTKLDGGIAWSRPELHVQERCGLWVIKGKYCLMKACHCLALGILCRIAKRTYVNATCFGCWETSFGFHLTKASGGGGGHKDSYRLPTWLEHYLQRECELRGCILIAGLHCRVTWWL